MRIKSRVPIGLLDELMIPCVYFLYDKGEIVYIGQAKQGLHRIVTHYKSEKIFTHFYIQPCGLDELDTIEANLIAEHLPKYNKIIPKYNSKIITWKQLKNMFVNLTWCKFKKLMELHEVQTTMCQGVVYYDKQATLKLLEGVFSYANK